MNNYPLYGSWVVALEAADKGLILVMSGVGCSLIWYYALRRYPRLAQIYRAALIVGFYFLVAFGALAK